MHVTRQLRLFCLSVLLTSIFYCKSVLSIDCNVTININSSNREGVFSSNSFPSSYPKLPEAYVCWFALIPDDQTKYIQLTFDDFHLSSQYELPDGCDTQTMDYLSIYSGSTMDKHDNYCGCRRPDVVSNIGGMVWLKLHVQPARIDDATFRGFQAKFKYLTATEYRDLGDVYLYSDKPNINSGFGSVSHPVAPLPAAVTSTFFDGLYYIEAASDMRITVTAFIQNTSPTSCPIQIRDGLTSHSTLLYNGTLEDRTVRTSSQSSMYIRWCWEGVTHDAAVTLNLEFTAFKQPVSFGVCERDYFYCKNHRCISTSLTCDSRDNCGDGSDEVKGSPTDICHEDDCSASPCLNGGTCVPESPSCNCRFGYWGNACQYENTDCASSPCMNGGTCRPFSNAPGFVCFCPSNTHGSYCQDRVGSTCQSGQCNEGTCVDGTCICRANYIGNFCEIQDNTTNTDYTDLQHTSIMIGAFVGAVCLLSICWLIAMARKRQGDEPVGRVTRIVSVHSRDERGMRPSVTGANIDLPPTYSDCVFDEADGTPPVKRIGVPAMITEENEQAEPDEDVFAAEEPQPQQQQSENGPLSPPPTYESVALSEDDGIVFEVTHLPDVVSQDRPSSRQNSHSDTAV